MYLKLTNGTPSLYSIERLRRDNPNTSFPKIPSAAFLADLGVYPYTRPDRPDVDQLTAKVIDGDFEQDADGNWIWPCVVRQLSQEDAAGNVRSRRGNLLAESDWIVTKSIEVGQSIPADWAAYRQALRDVTTQEGFPYSVAWPTKPE